MNDEEKYTALFHGLIMQFSSTAMMAMGKIVNPLTGKLDRNMDLAQSAIDMMEMLEFKTQNNLDKNESRYLKNTLTEMRLNYIEELKKAREEESEAPSEESETAPDSPVEEETTPPTESETESESTIETDATDDVSEEPEKKDD